MPRRGRPRLELSQNTKNARRREQKRRSEYERYHYINSITTPGNSAHPGRAEETVENYNRQPQELADGDRQQDQRTAASIDQEPDIQPSSTLVPQVETERATQAQGEPGHQDQRDEQDRATRQRGIRQPYAPRKQATYVDQGKKQYSLINSYHRLSRSK
jgi:hypothetical protein